MTIAMLTIPVVDGLAKYLSAGYSPLFLGWIRYAVATIVVLPLSAALHGRRLFPAERRSSHASRTVFLVGAMTLYFAAVARITLAAAASAFLIAPIVAVILSVLVLKERMTLRKTLALACGVAGSLVMLRPGGAIEIGTLFAFGSGVLFALYLIATRHAAETSDPLPTLAFQCVVGTALMIPQAVMSWRTPAADDALLFAGLGGISAFSHALSIAAFRFAPASTLAPLVYLELVGAASVGYVAFREIPSANTVVGAACIVLAGLILLRDRR